MSGKGKSERITKRVVDAAQPGERVYRIWDAELKGFGLKVTPTGSKTYIATYRAGTGRSAPQREYTLGKHGVLTPDQAREHARKVLSEARLGADPQAERKRLRGELTVGQLCDLYLEEGASGKKASTLQTDRYRIDSHIKPLLGRKTVSSITQGDVERFMRDLAAGKTAVKRERVGPRAYTQPRGGKGTASRTVGLLGGIFAFAVRHKLRPDNPVHGVTRYKDGRSERFLSAQELARLGEAIDAAEAEGRNAMGLAVIRLLVTTGARKGEIEALRWDEVDFERSALRLRDSKTGAKVVPIGGQALALLTALAEQAKAERLEAEAKAKAAGEELPPPSPYVFPASKGEALHWTGTKRIWEDVRAKAGLSDVRLHDLRHTYASLAVGAAGGGNSLAVIGKLLGHKDVRTTARYAHLADDPVKQAADRIAAAAAAGLSGRSAEVVEFAKTKRGGAG